MILPVFFIIYKLKSSINCKLSTVNYHLVPLYSVGITAALVVFQRICQSGCVTTEGEVVARVWSENHRTAHVETVKITSQTGGGHTNLVVVKIITG